MVYKVIGLMSGSSLDGLDIAYVYLQERVSSAKDAPRNWEYTFLHTACYPYTKEWKDRLAGATELSALDYQLLHVEYGHYLGREVLRFIEENGLHYQVQLIASHGHTTFHLPARKMTAQLGDGAAIAATTGINVVSDLRAMDLALGGQGAPIVPVGEQLLLSGHEFFLNLGGIANISAAGGRNMPGTTGGSSGGTGQGAAQRTESYVAFDVCPAGRVLNSLAALVGKDYDEDGALAAKGSVDAALLERLNGLSYYGEGYPKSLGNAFGTETVWPMIREGMRTPDGMVDGMGMRTPDGMRSVEDALRTYLEHIAVQIARAVEGLKAGSGKEVVPGEVGGLKMLVTGGGAHNRFLTGRIQELLQPLGVELVVPISQLVDYKEALVMALIGVLRWREENNVLASVTGASRDSIGGAVWLA